MALTKEQIFTILKDGFNAIDHTSGAISNDAALDTMAEGIFQASEGVVEDTVPEVPDDGKRYNRSFGLWEEDTILEAPIDNKQYTRFNEAWVENSATGTFFDKTPLEDTTLDLNQVQEALVYILNDHILGGFHLADDGYDPNNP